jgi:hypothetical protein
MKTLKITATILIAAALLNFIRDGRSFHIAKVLPFCDGRSVNTYHWGGLIMCAIALWGYFRLKNRS